MTLSQDPWVVRLDAAVADRNDEVCVHKVKAALVDAIASGEIVLPTRFLEPTPDRYARRLVHRDPAGRYTVIVMVWGPGQGTPLHDHAGIWCVECVLQGRILVTSYAVRGGDPDRGVVTFERQAEIVAGPGEAGALIPPFEYHVLANAQPASSVTIHVYGGEMTHCHVFRPVEGGYRREYRELSYTPVN
jgi:predicted metal-dependent enzyme (double-stranded beta helix superfamily)